MSFCGLHFFDSIDQRDAIILRQSMELAPSNTLLGAFFFSHLEVQLMVDIDFNEFNRCSIWEGSCMPNTWSVPGASRCSINICWTNKWMNTSEPLCLFSSYPFCPVLSIPITYTHTFKILFFMDFSIFWQKVERTPSFRPTMNRFAI